MIKVINIVTDTNIGGAGRYILTFLDNYKLSGAAVDIEVFIPYDSLLKPELDKRKARYTEVKYINDKSFDIKAVNCLLKLFKEKKPDIVHTHAAMSGRIAAVLYGKCAVTHTRHSVFEPPAKLTRFPLKQVSGIINNRLSDIIIAVSPAAKKNMTDTGTDPKKIKVIYNGVDKIKKVNADAADRLRKKYDLSSADFVVSMTARLDEIKGHDYVLDAAKLIGKTESSVKFLIAGTGAREEHLKKRVADEGIKNVVFVGFIKDVSQILSITDLQLNASFGTEATSLSLLEGMSAGIPAVVSDYGGNPYVILDGVEGIVIPQKKPEAIAEAILRLKNETELYTAMSKNAVAAYESRFTSKVMTDQIINLYMEFYNGKKKG